MWECGRKGNGGRGGRMEGDSEGVSAPGRQGRWESLQVPVIDTPPIARVKRRGDNLTR